MKGRMGGFRAPVAVPPAVGPLPCDQISGHLLDTAVDETQADRVQNSISLLGCAPSPPPVHRLWWPRRGFAGPVDTLIDDRPDRRIARRVTDVGQQGCHPMRPGPFLVWAPGDGAVGRSLREQGLHARTCGDIASQTPHGPGIGVLAEDAGSDSVTDAGLVGFQKALNDCIHVCPSDSHATHTSGVTRPQCCPPQADGPAPVREPVYE